MIPPAVTETTEPKHRSVASVIAGRSLYWAVGTSFAIRLAVIPFTYADRLDPWREHWRFGWEMGMVGRSLASGYGFASPFPPQTGPTAWVGPLYPALMAAVFKVVGLFSVASAVTLLSLNALFSALTCVPIFYIAGRTLGSREAKWAAWIWALFPYAIYISATRMWENSLTTLLVTVLIWYTLRLEERGTAALWAGYGALWGLAGLSSPGCLALLPAFGLWIAVRRQRRGESWFTGAVAGALLFALVIAPWEMRNLNTFHRFIPLRDNFWMEVRVGNTGDLSDVYPDWAHPGRSPQELALYQQLGETAYLARAHDLAISFVREHPRSFAGLTLRRVVYTWTGFWSMNPVFRRNEPLQFPNTFFCTMVSVLAFLGLRRMWRERREWVAPYLIVLGIFPLVYYVTHQGIDYRHPIDPMLVILIAGSVVGFSRRQPKTAAAV